MQTQKLVDITCLKMKGDDLESTSLKASNSANIMLSTEGKNLATDYVEQSGS